METVIFSGAFALIGVVVGAVLGPWVNARIARRDRARAKVDDAIAKLRLVQALRHYPTGVPNALLDPEGVAPEEVFRFNRSQRENTFADFYRAMREARSALALVQDLSPAISTALTSGWEITEEAATSLEAVLKQSNPRALESRKQALPPH